MNTTCFTFPTAPLGKAAWVADPSCRGTFRIISLCLSTTIICVWSAVHRDIPLKRLSAFRTLLRDAPLVLVALFAPELLLYFALNQYMCARKLVKIASEHDGFKASSVAEQHAQVTSKIRRPFGPLKLGGQEQGDDTELLYYIPQPEITNRCRQHAFTMTHGFYATMGGFTFFAIDEDGKVGKSVAKLTFKGVKFLMEHDPDLIPDISLTSISDRSKSSSFGKGLLAVQVVWFCVNCASRLAERLPLSLLELSTLAHGFYTLSSFAMWWHKPLSIDEPTLVKDSESSPERTLETLAYLQVISVPGDERDKLIENWKSYLQHTNISPRLKLASKALQRYQFSTLWCGKDRPSKTRYSTFDSVPRLRMLYLAPAIDFDSWTSWAGDYSMIVCIPIAYGLLHAFGLHTQFPSVTGRLLWRFAVIFVSLSGTISVVANIVGRHVVRKWEPMCNFIEYRVITSLYLLISSYLLVESIHQLWYLPLEAYMDASWSYYVPPLALVDVRLATLYVVFELQTIDGFPGSIMMDVR